MAEASLNNPTSLAQKETSEQDFTRTQQEDKPQGKGKKIVNSKQDSTRKPRGKGKKSGFMLRPCHHKSLSDRSKELRATGPTLIAGGTMRRPAIHYEAAAAKSAKSDPLEANYGDLKLNELQAVTGRKWTEVRALHEGFKDQVVLIRGWLQSARVLDKKLAFLVVRERRFTVQCVLAVKADTVSVSMLKYASGLSAESIIDIEGIVSVPDFPIESTTQKVEIQVRKLYSVNNSSAVLPFSIEDAARSEAEIEKAEQAGEKVVRVNQDTRLNHRVLDLRTPANQAIFCIEDEFEAFFSQFLRTKGFRKIHTPTVVARSSEGGSAVFKLGYMGKPACLAQSPQLHKQMAICSGFGRIFEIGPVFRAEYSFTHRHLGEFIGLDLEMEIKEHYSEVMDIVDSLFVAMFDSINKNCQEELEAIGKQYPFKPLKYLPETLRLKFEEGIKMLQEAGVEVDPLGDLNTENERKLGKLVKEKYDTEFYILYGYPSAIRPFYTMRCCENPAYSNSFGVFLRGEEIISGSQRVHEPQALTQRATELGIDVRRISTYIDSFTRGAPPHGGFGVGLGRLVMLFCGLSNIRKTSMFPIIAP